MVGILLLNSHILEVGGCLAVTSRQRELCRVVSRFGNLFGAIAALTSLTFVFKPAQALWALAPLQGLLRFRLGCIGGFGKGRCQPVRSVHHCVVCICITRLCLLLTCLECLAMYALLYIHTNTFSKA